MRIIYAGTPQVAVPALQALLQSDLEVVGVLTRPPARAGRGRSLQESPVHVAAEAAGIPVITSSRPADEEVLEAIRALQPDLGVVVAYGAILPAAVLNIPHYGWINLHFSELPRWRGAAPAQWSIRAQDPFTATTVFQLDEGMDTGPIYSQQRTAIEPGETAGELLERLAQVGAPQLVAVARKIRDGQGTARAQSEEGITRAPRLAKKDGFVDFSAPASEVDAQIRSVTPNPGAWTTLPRGETLKLGPLSKVAAEPDPPDRSPDGAPEGLLPGEVQATKHRVWVGCEAGAAQLGQVAPAGKQWMDAAAWWRGARLGPGTRLAQGVRGEG